MRWPQACRLVPSNRYIPITGVLDLIALLGSFFAEEEKKLFSDRKRNHSFESSGN